MKSSLFDDDFNEAMDQIDVATWLDGEGIKYKEMRGASGLQLNVRECPCCGNSDYKVYLNADSGLGNCFHGDCETKFNKWKFIKFQLGLSAPSTAEYIKRYAREQGWQPPKTKSAPVFLSSAELILPKSFALPHAGRNLKYLENRNITSKIAEYFSLRFSKSGQFQYASESGKVQKQSYEDRIIIPIFDLEGKLVSFQGRDITGKAEKKYLFPPGFSATGTHLYNGHNAIGAAEIVINEGVFDVAATKIALDGELALRGVTAVGSFGKHLSRGDDQSQLAKLLHLKAAGLKKITFMWDGERQAIKDAVEAAQMVRGCGLIARVALLPKGKDPNEITPFEVRAAYWQATTMDQASASKLLMSAEMRY